MLDTGRRDSIKGARAIRPMQSQQERIVMLVGKKRVKCSSSKLLDEQWEDSLERIFEAMEELAVQLCAKKGTQLYYFENGEYWYGWVGDYNVPNHPDHVVYRPLTGSWFQLRAGEWHMV